MGIIDFGQKIDGARKVWGALFSVQLDSLQEIRFLTWELGAQFEVPPESAPTACNF